MERLGLLQEGRVRDLISTADSQLASRSYDAAIDTYRTALAELSGDAAAADRSAIESRLAAALLGRARYHQAAGRVRQAFASVTGTLLLEPGNPEAAELREQLTGAMPELAAEAPAAPPAPPEPESVPRLEPEPIEPPAFHLLDSDPSLLESDRRPEYTPEPELLSILNPAPPLPEPSVRNPAAFIVLAAIGIWVALNVVSNYRRHYVNIDRPPVDRNARTSPLAAQPPALGVAGGAGDDTVYFVSGDVILPMLRTRVDPDYTEDARQAKIQGTVFLSLQIDPFGRPVNLRVLRGLGGGLDERAIEAVRKWRYQPGAKDGKDVTVAAQVEVQFRLQ